VTGNFPRAIGLTDDQIKTLIKDAIDNAVRILMPRISALEESVRQIREQPHYQRPNGGR
jgi:phosphoenolpyruvate-protein kinase (PTS system EI component)